MAKNIQKFQFKIWHFITYSFSFLLYGCLLSSLGPLIPYLAFRDGKMETQYSFIFFCRALGYLSAGFLIKKLTKKLSLHHLIIISSTIIGIFGTIFCFCKTSYLEGLMIYFIALGCGSIEVIINMCLLEISSHYNQQKWMNIAGGIFGVGGLIGPIIVYMFQINSYMVIGIGMTVISLLYFFLQSAENNSHQFSKIQKNQSEPSDLQLSKKQNSNKYENVPNYIEFRLCTLLFLYIGIQISFGGWISSYAVIKKVTSKQQATIFSSIFWVCITIFRFVIALVPLKISFKLKIFAFGLFFSLLISVISSLVQQYLFTVLFSSISFGLFLSPVFPFLITIPSEFNMALNLNQRANLMIFASLGQALVSTFVGYIMDLFTPNMLFYSTTLLSALYGGILLSTIKKLKQLNNLQLISTEASIN